MTVGTGGAGGDSADATPHADTLCICGHYGIEHAPILSIPCQAADLFGDDCGCFGFEPDQETM